MKRRRLVVAAVGAVVAMAAGCGTDEGSTATSPPEADTSVVGPARSTTEPTELPTTVGTAAETVTTMEVVAAPTTEQGEPIQPDSMGGWRASTPEEQGIDSVAVAEVVDYLRTQDNIAIHSLLIIRHGHVVADAYFHPYVPDAVHDLQSASKSFASTLIGIAIDRGDIENVDQPVLSFFPERTVANVDAAKESMTLEDLLVMRSGLRCGSNADLAESPDWVQFILDQPRVHHRVTRIGCLMSSWPQIGPRPG